jgi:hypothetical protein
MFCVLLFKGVTVIGRPCLLGYNQMNAAFRLYIKDYYHSLVRLSAPTNLVVYLNVIINWKATLVSVYLVESFIRLACAAGAHIC